MFYFLCKNCIMISMNRASIKERVRLLDGELLERIDHPLAIRAIHITFM